MLPRAAPRGPCLVVTLAAAVCEGAADHRVAEVVPLDEERQLRAHRASGDGQHGDAVGEARVARGGELEATGEVAAPIRRLRRMRG